MNSLKALVVRAAPALVWLACAAGLAAAERTSASSAAAGYGILPLAPLFPPTSGYSGNLTLLNAPPPSSTRPQLGQAMRVMHLSADGQKLEPGPYTLRPGDRVTIAVFGEPKLRIVDQTVDAEGNIPLALIAAPLHVGGLSVTDAQAAIARAYREKGLVAEPNVLLHIQAYAPRRVIVRPPETLEEKNLPLSDRAKLIQEKYLRLTTPVEPAAPPAPR